MDGITNPQQRSTRHGLATAVQAIRDGELVVVTDDEQRENEGDLICAADRVTPEQINFMARHGRGLICAALTQDRLHALDIRPTRKRGQRDQFNTAFMESVDARTGISTGISAADRARTIHLLVNPDTTVDDLVSPGHVFPLAATTGGVLERPGHTEAAVDLALLADCEPAGVICEIIRDDGEMARWPDLVAFAETHGLAMTSVAELVAWRKANGLTSPLVDLVVS